MFIVLQVDRTRCARGANCIRCVEVCPVDVFRRDAGHVLTDAENEDECTLCELCLQACPQDALRLIRLYEEGYETAS